MARLGGATYRVGDTFKLGQSSRLYLLGGPEQMMPEEGLSREQRKQLRIMQVCSCGLGSLVRAWASPQRNNVYDAVIAVLPTTLLSCWTVSTLYVGRQSGSRSVTRFAIPWFCARPQRRAKRRRSGSAGRRWTRRWPPARAGASARMPKKSSLKEKRSSGAPTPRHTRLLTTRCGRAHT